MIAPKEQVGVQTEIEITSPDFLNNPWGATVNLMRGILPRQKYL